MAQIPTSSITLAAIKAETGVAADGTLDQCRAASESFVMTATDVPGHTRDGNEQTNTNASPWNNTMAEWAGYVHTQDFASPTYYARNSTSSNVNTLITNACYYGAVTATSNEPFANAAVVFYAILASGPKVEFYMVPDHTQISVSHPPSSETASWRNTAGTSQSFSGNFSSGFTAVKIAETGTLPATFISALNGKVSITTAIISGTGGYDAVVSGYTAQNSGTMFTPSATKNMRTPFSTVWSACFNTASQAPYYTVIFTVEADGYNDLVFNKFVASLTTTAVSNNCL